MDKNIIQRIFFIILLLGVSVMIFFVFLPFLEVLVLAVIFAVVLHPLSEMVSKELKGRNGWAAFIVVFMFALIVMVPLGFLGTNLFDESRSLYEELQSNNQIDYIEKVTALIENPIKEFLPNFSLNTPELVRSGADWITEHFTTILSSFFGLVTSTILIFISLFFFLRDGDNFKKTLVRLSPLDDEYDEKIFTKVKKTITSTVKGVILIALIQGLLAGIGMWIFGVPNPTLWGTVSAVASLVPGLGTAIVFLPAIAYMFFIVGNTFSAVGLLLWGILIVGLVDNFLTPYMYSREVSIHPLLMLFAVLGGLIVFGPIGFIFGPIILGLFFSLIEIYQTLILNKNIN